MKKFSISLLVFCIAVKAIASGHIATATSANPTCNAACNGTASAMASGGVGPYGFTWAGPSGYTAAGANISGLCDGAYVVTAIDSSDMSTAVYTVNLTAPPALSASIGGGGPMCAGSCITLSGSASGGVGGYNYSWSPATGLSATNISNPTACPVTSTTYILSVTDANSCLANASVTVTVNPIPPVTASATNASCGLCTGTLTASGATTYSWSGGYFGVHPVNVCAGTYTVTGASSSGCSATATVTVLNTSTAPSATVTTVIPASCGACNGTATVSASGGTPPYTYDWYPGTPPGDGTATAYNLCGITTYTITVTDAAGCGANASATILNSTTISAIGTTTTNASCSVSDGSITITSVTGGTGPYAYSVDGSAYSAAVNYTNLPGGPHAVTAKDANGCVLTISVTIYSPAGPADVTYTTVNSNCTSNTGEIDITGTIGGVPSYTYFIDGINYGSMTHFTGLAAGSHNIMVADGNGCTYIEYLTIGTLNPPVIVTDSTNNISCSGTTPGNIYVSITAGTPGYSYSWTPSGTTTQDLINITGVGTYVLNVTDAAGCTAIHTYYIGTASTLHASSAYTFGNCGAMATITAIPAGGTPPYTYVWNTTPVQTTATATNLPDGYFHCTITDANGCITGISQSVYNSCYSMIKGRVYNDANANCIYDAGDSPISGRLVSVTTGGTGYGYTDLLGNYTIYTTGMNNTVTHSNPLYTNVICPVGNTQTVNFTTMGDTIYNVDFADQYIPGMNDLVVNYYPGTARPGFVQNGVLYYKNVGTTTISGVTVDLTLDSILAFSSAMPSPASYTYPTAHWNIGTLTAGQSGYIYVYDNVPTITMGGYIGRVLNYSALINPVTGDQSPSDNYTAPGIPTSTPPVTVIVAAWDPNAKEVSPAGDILATDSVLHYTIQFQNTGTDTAFTVVLKDTLSQFLDPATVEAGVASHPYAFNVAFNGELTWTFSNILLPDSAANQEGSHGFATFTVKQRAGNPAGTQIDNTAHIYFDFNEAVVTNTVSNEIVDLTTGIETAGINNKVRVYPNPFNDNATFMIENDPVNESYSFEMKDVLGKTVKVMGNITDKQFSISRNGLENGIYFYKIYNTSGITGIGKVVIR